MHGIFPTHNKYYLRTEIFPLLSKKEMKEVFYPTKKLKQVNIPKRSFKRESEE
jgi:hypothetical protein